MGKWLDNRNHVNQPAAVVATPGNVSGCTLWLNAAFITGKSNGDSMSSWDDSSGNGITTTQATGARQPTYQTNQVNGLPGVLFGTAANNGMLTNLTVTNPFSVLCVYASVSNSNTSRRLLQGSNNWLLGPYQLSHQYYDGAFIVGNSVVAGEWTYAVITQSSAGAVFRTNGTQRGTNANTTAPGTLGLSASGAFAEVANSTISELCMYNKVLSSTEITALENYVRYKYALS